jgi:hypothetical protein
MDSLLALIESTTWVERTKGAVSESIRAGKKMCTITLLEALHTTRIVQQ